MSFVSWNLSLSTFVFLIKIARASSKLQINSSNLTSSSCSETCLLLLLVFSGSKLCPIFSGGSWEGKISANDCELRVENKGKKGQIINENELLFIF